MRERNQKPLTKLSGALGCSKSLTPTLSLREREPVHCFDTTSSLAKALGFPRRESACAWLGSSPPDNLPSPHAPGQFLETWAQDRAVNLPKTSKLPKSFLDAHPRAFRHLCHWFVFPRRVVLSTTRGGKPVDNSLRAGGHNGSVHGPGARRRLAGRRPSRDSPVAPRSYPPFFPRRERGGCSRLSSLVS